MSADIIRCARELIQNDDSLTDQNNCRDAVSKLYKQLRSDFPRKDISILAYPEAREGEGVHYAISADNQIINPVSAPGFPQYLGDKKAAVPTFSQMKKVSAVV